MRKILSHEEHHNLVVRRRLLLIVFTCVFLITVIVCRSYWLPVMAKIWIVNDPLVKSDVIVVLGGGRETRPFAAAQLFKDNWAQQVFVMNPKPSPTEMIGMSEGDAYLTRRILVHQGVPDSAITISPVQVVNSYDEAIAFRDWAKTNSIRRVIIPTDIFHTRRVGWLYRKELPGSMDVCVRAVPVRDYSADDWWRNENGVVAFQNEVLKFIYYWFKY